MDYVKLCTVCNIIFYDVMFVDSDLPCMIRLKPSQLATIITRECNRENPINYYLINKSVSRKIVYEY